MINPRIHLELPANLAYLDVLSSAIAALLETETTLNNAAFHIKLAVHEACANIIDHAHPQNNEQYVSIILVLDNQTRHFRAELFDMGKAFEPPPEQSGSNRSTAVWQKSIQKTGTRYHLLSVSEPTLEQERGRGLFLMSQLMDEISCLVTDHGNHWQLVKQFEQALQHKTARASSK